MNNISNSVLSLVFLLFLFFLFIEGIASDRPFPSDDKNLSGEDSLAHELGKSDSSDNSVSDDVYNLIYKSIFVDTTKRRDLTYVDDFSKAEDPFLKYTGKRIGKIYRKDVQIFGGSVYDTIEVQMTGLTNLVDKLHITTRDMVIIQNLLFSTGDTINPFKLADNERIIRKLPYIHDAKIIVIDIEDDPDVVDLLIITQDVFSLGVGGSVSSPERFKVNLFERNLLGMGWEINNEFHFNTVRSPELGYDGKFIINNIYGSFVSGLVNIATMYETNLFRISLNRSFLTPETKYAGGLDFQNTSIYSDLTGTRLLNYKLLAQDYWVGRAFKIADPSSRKNLTISTRYYTSDFRERPEVKPDSNFSFHDYHYILGSIYLTKILHFESSLVLGFGNTEDIPYGYNISMTLGYGNTEFEERTYGGFRLRGATFSDKLGYILGVLSFGSFYDGNRMEDGVINLSSLYFTPLIEMGRNYKLRQFLSGSYTIGIRRLADDQLKFEIDRGVPIFNSDALKGTQKATISLQSILFSPWNLFGFRFAIEGFAEFGWIGSNYRPPDLNRINSALGVIFRLRNESLVISTFQIGFVFYPQAMEGMQRFNWRFSTSEPQLFRQLEGRKPSIIPFR